MVRLDQRRPESDNNLEGIEASHHFSIFYVDSFVAWVGEFALVLKVLVFRDKI